MTENELGGSHYYKIYDQLGANVPKLDLKLAPRIAHKISTAIDKGLITSCHDCSEGGLAIALAEMAFAGGIGIDADLKGLPKAGSMSIAAQLFSESTSRYIVEIEPRNFDAFAKLMLNVPFGMIGKVAGNKMLTIKADNKTFISADIECLKKAWQKTFNW
jgi:phosphoribosylformylglycinamidine synthase subunit PurSL